MQTPPNGSPAAFEFWNEEDYFFFAAFLAGAFLAAAFFGAAAFLAGAFLAAAFLGAAFAAFFAAGMLKTLPSGVTTHKHLARFAKM
jgi:hypothetical protein